jgi:hypothetical protein
MVARDARQIKFRPKRTNTLSPTATLVKRLISPLAGLYALSGPGLS